MDATGVPRAKRDYWFGKGWLSGQWGTQISDEIYKNMGEVTYYKRYIVPEYKSQHSLAPFDGLSVLAQRTQKHQVGRKLSSHSSTGGIDAPDFGEGAPHGCCHGGCCR